ncbi:hypothetical protein MP638_001737 [Amoeboaphelidium occidentale]|nr:hypothetical protein MP638_001737 [Amoeboaphelidium occidentale]
MDNLDASKEEPIPVKPTALLESKHDVEIELADDSDRAKLLSATTFEAIISNPDILKGVYAMGYQKPSKIQGTAVPLLLSTPYKNFIGQSQSGSGKTGAFSLTILSRIDKSIGQTQALVLAPTRELANQIISVIKQMSQFSGISSVLAVKDSVPRGGTLSDHIVVGTPGTVQDLLRRKAILADQIRIFVIDEADVMLDHQGMGDQTIKVKKFLPRDCQIVLFSATYREDVARFAERVVPNANKISLKREELSVDAIKQLYIDCQNEEEKARVLSLMYGVCTIGQSIVFCNRKDTSEKIAAKLRADGHLVTVIHGSLDPSERDRIFNSYKNGETKVLISTNVLARGIDVLDVNVVINFDLPTDQRGNPDFETYLHRIGRTGRFGRHGISVNLVHDGKTRSLNAEIEKYFGKMITKVSAEDPVVMEKELKDALKNR